MPAHPQRYRYLFSSFFRQHNLIPMQSFSLIFSYRKMAALSQVYVLTKSYESLCGCGGEPETFVQLFGSLEACYKSLRNGIVSALGVDEKCFKNVYVSDCGVPYDEAKT